MKALNIFLLEGDVRDLEERRNVALAMLNVSDPKQRADAEETYAALTREISEKQNKIEDLKNWLKEHPGPERFL